MKYFVSSTFDVRRTRKPAPLWMALNRYNGKCWCGKPKALWNTGMRKYCTNEHADMWFYKIRPYWEVFRVNILERDGNRCVVCGSSKGTMNVDHKVPFAAGGDFWDEENLQTLCIPCHKRKNLLDLNMIKHVKKSDGMLSLDVYV